MDKKISKSIERIEFYKSIIGENDVLFQQQLSKYGEDNPKLQSKLLEFAIIHRKMTDGIEVEREKIRKRLKRKGVELDGYKLSCKTDIRR